MSHTDYTDSSGNDYLHVSAISKVADDPTGLIKWAKKLTEKEADDIYEKRTKEGQEIHSALKDFLFSVNVPDVSLVSRYAPYCEIADHWAQVTDVTFDEDLSEKSIIDHELRITATPDFVAERKGYGVGVGDWKTGSNFYHSQIIQVVGYAYLLGRNKSLNFPLEWVTIVRFDKLKASSEKTFIKELKRTRKFYLKDCAIAIEERQEKITPKLIDIFLHCYDVVKFRKEIIL